METVMGIVRSIGIAFVGTLLLLMPGFFPAITVLSWIFLWIPIYSYIIFESFFHNLQNTLPWIVMDPNQDCSFLFIVIISLPGFIFGLGGFASSFLFWLPFLRLYSFIVFMGLGVVNPHGMTGYVMDNYDSHHCPTIGESIEPNHPTCLYVPKNGKQLPTFSTDQSPIDVPFDVIPYNG